MMTQYEQLCSRIDAAIRPIDAWPGELTRFRRVSQFRADWASTCRLLAAELGHLNAQRRVVQIAIRESMLKQDGYPRGDAQRLGGLIHPGVIIAFETKSGPLSFPCDTYIDWRDNVRAIALALEALRAVDRYGVTRNAEQYRGWVALPPAPAETFRTAEQAAEWLSRYSDCTREGILDRADVRQAAYRMAAAKLHPDSGGSHEEFVRLQAAKEMLEN